jgi:predicted nucleotidyltransferase
VSGALAQAGDIDLRPIAPLLERLRAHFRPQQIWLFGSRARGDARPDSDWDLVAVVDDDAQDELFDPTTAWRLLHNDAFHADVVVFPKSEFEEDRLTPNTIPFAVAREGLLLNER